MPFCRNILVGVDLTQYDVSTSQPSAARSGMAGVMIGNTAERLLPQVSCSLLAVNRRISYRR